MKYAPEPGLTSFANLKILLMKHFILLYFKLTSISLVAGINDPSKRQTPCKATEGTIQNVLSFIERFASMFGSTVNAIHNGESKNSGQTPANHRHCLSWYFVLK